MTDSFDFSVIKQTKQGLALVNVMIYTEK